MSVRTTVSGSRCLVLLASLGLLSCSKGSKAPPPPPPPPPPPTASYAIEFATYVGGNDFDEIRDPVLLSGGRLLFGARAKSSDMPTAAGSRPPLTSAGRGWRDRPTGSKLPRAAISYSGVQPVRPTSPRPVVHIGLPSNCRPLDPWMDTCARSRVTCASFGGARTRVAAGLEAGSRWTLRKT